MDHYPEHLAPEFEESGAVKTPFDEWWARVLPDFPNVPEDVARHWMHEHWSHSPYSWLPSKSYAFSLRDWPTSELKQIRSRWCDWDADNVDCLKHGEHLIEGIKSVYRYRTAVYLEENRDFPAPIIVLDNRDGHLKQGQAPVPAWEQLPAAYLLIEGHRRLNMALYLASVGRLGETVRVWLMERVAR
jgi:hypothetical protein